MLNRRFFVALCAFEVATNVSTLKMSPTFRCQLLISYTTIVVLNSAVTNANDSSCGLKSCHRYYHLYACSGHHYRLTRSKCIVIELLCGFLRMWPETTKSVEESHWKPLRQAKNNATFAKFSWPNENGYFWPQRPKTRKGRNSKWLSVGRKTSFNSHLGISFGRDDKNRSSLRSSFRRRGNLR